MDICILLGTIMNNTAVDIHLQIFVWTNVFISLRISGSHGKFTFNFFKKLPVFSKLATLFYIPNSNVLWGFPFLYILCNVSFVFLIIVGIKWHLGVCLIWPTMLSICPQRFLVVLLNAYSKRDTKNPSSLIFTAISVHGMAVWSHGQHISGWAFNMTHFSQTDYFSSSCVFSLPSSLRFANFEFCLEFRILWNILICVKYLVSTEATCLCGWFMFYSRFDINSLFLKGMYATQHPLNILIRA